MLPPGIRLIGPALLLEHSKTLILADLHLGAEKSLVKNGILLPRLQQETTITMIKEVLAQAKPTHIILDGDIKHDFGTIDEEEWRDILTLLDLLLKKAKVSVVKGNHDALLLPILKKRGITLVPSLLIDDWLIVHGDKEPSLEDWRAAKGIIIGHEHPSLMLDDGLRRENYKCFLHGTYKEKDLIVLPSTYPLVEGSDILQEEALGPILKAAEHLEAYVVENLETLYFGPLSGIGANLK